MNIRVVTASTPSGDKEAVVFTEDFDVDASDFFVSDLSVDNDQIIDCELPPTFPMEYVLFRE